jgi:HTH-type transcriptional regulator/antitoxin HigA
MIDTLLDRRDLAEGEQDYLEVLSDLVHSYEIEEHPIPPASDAELLRFLMDANGVSQIEVAKKTGIIDSTISKIVSGQRRLNRAHIAKLARYFNVDPGMFLSGKQAATQQ